MKTYEVHVMRESIIRVTLDENEFPNDIDLGVIAEDEVALACETVVLPDTMSFVDDYFDINEAVEV